jgi:EAL domain-containing protein (putative c-di-GMP-specific phosphodiesterase class I)
VVSSYQRLVRYKFDKVKIHDSLLPTLHDSVGVWARKRLLLKGLISTVNSLGIEAVMDGIEKDTQFNFFQSLPVTEWQGSYWGREVDFKELVSRVEKERLG